MPRSCGKVTSLAEGRNAILCPQAWVKECSMAKYICFPVVEPPSSGGFDGCIAALLIVFAIGGLIVAGFNHLFGLDKNSSNQSQQTQATLPQSQSSSEGNSSQSQPSTEKPRHHHLVYRNKEADFQPTHHSRVRVSEYNNSDTSETSNLHSNTRYDAENHDRNYNVSGKSSTDSPVGDLHSNSDIGSSTPSNDGNALSSSSGDISGGLH